MRSPHHGVATSGPAPRRSGRTARPASTPLRAAAPLAAAVLGAAGVVAALEAVLLARTGIPARGCAGDLTAFALLALGAVLVVPLALALGGWSLARRHARALHELTVDDLTGVGSRRAFGADLPDAVRDAREGGRPLTLALVELTGVAPAVDLLGRRRTEALVAVAAATLATPDTGRVVAAYRLTGELFAVLLPGLGPDAAIGAVDDLLAQVAMTAAPLGAGAGLCSLDARCPDAQLLLVGASAALDEARALGGGRVVASSDEDSGLRWLATPGASRA